LNEVNLLCQKNPLFISRLPDFVSEFSEIIEKNGTKYNPAGKTVYKPMYLYKNQKSNEKYFDRHIKFGHHFWDVYTGLSQRRL